MKTSEIQKSTSTSVCVCVLHSGLVRVIMSSEGNNMVVDVRRWLLLNAYRDSHAAKAVYLVSR